MSFFGLERGDSKYFLLCFQFCFLQYPTRKLLLLAFFRPRNIRAIFTALGFKSFSPAEKGALANTKTTLWEAHRIG